jgi:hypothetical protein
VEKKTKVKKEIFSYLMLWNEPYVVMTARLPSFNNTDILLNLKWWLEVVFKGINIIAQETVPLCKQLQENKQSPRK